MVMMMAVFGRMVKFHMAMFLGAMLIFCFEFKRCVRNAVFSKFLANGFFDLVCVSLSDNVERCIVVITVHAPNVYVVNVLYAFDVAKMLANFVDFDAVRRFFEEEVDGFF